MYEVTETNEVTETYEVTETECSYLFNCTTLNKTWTWRAIKECFLTFCVISTIAV
jgi:hypothetical protein